MFKKALKLLICSLVLAYVANAQQTNGLNNNQPKAMREFRAAWIATVANINWPSKPNLSTPEQQKEAIDLLNLLQKLNFNAAILQVRPQADALYQSNLEPWSYFLTGTQGKAPEPYYDPLQFWVTQAHARGLELHVWLNPYRAHHLTGAEESDGSVVKTKPNWVVKLKDGQYWMDPSKIEVQNHSAAVVKDIVKRYDIDGVHFDDYFYPYDSYNGGADFPDDESWAAYLQTGGKLSKSDWRRMGVNNFIKRIYKDIKTIKKQVKFGISPFGIWRPGYPPSIEGYDQYNKLYADAKLWLNKGWIDYFSPQLYWTVNNLKQSFPVLLGWWQKENTKNRHLWPGLNVGLGGDDKNVDEVINQIMITRGMLPDSKGVLHWSIGALQKHEKLRQGLLAGPYQNQALVPASPWLGKKKPKMPMVTVAKTANLLQVSWSNPLKNEVSKWVVYYKYGEKWSYKIMNSDEKNLDLLLAISKDATNKETVLLTAVGITAVNKTGNESEFKVYNLPELN